MWKKKHYQVEVKGQERQVGFQVLLIILNYK